MVISVLFTPILLSLACHCTSDDVAEVRGLGFAGVWVKHSPPKRLRNASIWKQNRIKIALPRIDDRDASFFGCVKYLTHWHGKPS